LAILAILAIFAVVFGKKFYVHK